MSIAVLKYLGIAALGFFTQYHDSVVSPNRENQENLCIVTTRCVIGAMQISMKIKAAFTDNEI